MPTRRIKPLVLAALGIVLLALFVWLNRTGKFEPRPYRDATTLLAEADNSKWPPGTINVTFGVYVQKVYNFEVQAQTFCAEGWVWLVWPQEFQDLLTAGNIPVAEILEPLNLERTTNFTFVPNTSAPVRLPDGRYCQTFEYYGNFYANGLDFRRFPFETIRLPLTFGLNPENPSLNAGNIRLIPDQTRFGVGEYTDVPGYVLTGKRLTEFLEIRQSTVGPPTARDGTETRFSRVQMDISYGTSTISAMLQLFLPLAVIMAVVLLAPYLAGSLWDVRIALPSTALLTLIFLQQGYRDQLPPLPYLTFIDQVYALCYGTALIIFTLFVWSSNRLDTAAEADRRSVIHYINRVDARFQFGLAIGLVVLICLSWFFPVR
jgi:hypothetical protein